MNAVIHDSTPSPEAALAAARDGLTEAQARHRTDAEALERAKQAAAECQREADRLASDEARWFERHSKKLSAWIESGGHGTRPVAAADAKAVQAQLSARANAVAAADALTRFEAAERESRQALAAAESAVRSAALAALARDGQALAERILARDRETEAMRRELQALREFVQPTREVRRAAPVPGDEVYMSVPELQMLADERLNQSVEKPFQADAAAAGRWRARLDELMSGSAETAESDERAA